MKNLQIALAVPDDVWDMQEVFYRSWLATYPNKEHGITEDDIEDWYKDRHSEEKLAKRREQLAKCPEGNHALIAKLVGQIVGVCRIIKHADSNHLQAIYVLPEHHGKGIGTAMWESAQQYFDQTKPTLVEVATYNAKAITFYQRLGFVDTGRRISDPKYTMKSGSIIPEMEMVRGAEKL